MELVCQYRRRSPFVRIFSKVSVSRFPSCISFCCWVVHDRVVETPKLVVGNTDLSPSLARSDDARPRLLPAPLPCSVFPRFPAPRALVHYTSRFLRNLSRQSCHFRIPAINALSFDPIFISTFLNSRSPYLPAKVFSYIFF